MNADPGSVLPHMTGQRGRSTNKEKQTNPSCKPDRGEGSGRAAAAAVWGGGRGGEATCAGQRRSLRRQPGRVRLRVRSSLACSTERGRVREVGPPEGKVAGWEAASACRAAVARGGALSGDRAGSAIGREVQAMRRKSGKRFPRGSNAGLQSKRYATPEFQPMSSYYPRH